MKSIKIKFTKEDRQNAAYYGNCDNCLLATALIRTGHVVLGVGGRHVRLLVEGKEQWFNITQGADTLTKSSTNAVTKPFYKVTIVGKQVKLVPRNAMVP